MRTSIVVRLVNLFARSSQPSDDTSPDAWKRWVGYIAPHRAHGMRGNQTEWDESECVTAGGSMHRPKRGRLNDVRIVPEEFVEAMHRADEEIAMLELKLKDLRKQQQERMARAFQEGTSITTEQAKAWGAAKMKAYAAKRETAGAK